MDGFDECDHGQPEGKCVICSLENENYELRRTNRLARAFARAKGRFHSQHAMCDLMEHFGLPCVRPGEEAPAVTCACGDSFPIDSYGAGFMAANGGVCENCDMMKGDGDADE